MADGTADFVDDYRRARQILDGLDCPYYVLAGNHDRRGTEHFVQVFDTPIEYAFEHGGWRFVALDGRRSVIPEQSLALLRRELEQTEPDDHVVILNHWPLLVPEPLSVLARRVYGSQLTVDNADEVVELIAEHPQVRLFVAGHTHRKIVDYGHCGLTAQQV